MTMRVFEAFGAGKKLITTNADIINYDFYRPENIYIFKDKFDFNDIFFRSNSVEVSDEIKENYSLKS